MVIRSMFLLLAATLTGAQAASAQEPKLRQILGGGYQYSGELAFSPDGKTLATVGGPGVRLLDVATGGRLAAFEGHEGLARQATFSRDGTTLAVASTITEASGSGQSELGWRIKLWDIRSGKPIRTLKGDGPGLQALAFSRDGKLLAGGNTIWDENEKCDMAEVRLFDSANGNVVHLIRSRGRLSGLTFFADGKRLLIRAPGASLWDVASGKALGESLGGMWLASSDDGRLAARPGLTYDRQGLSAAAVDLWDVDAQKKVSTLGGSAGEIRLASFSPDAKIFAAADGGYTRQRKAGAVRIWDTATGKSLAVLADHSVRSLAFSPDGRTLATTTGGLLEIKLWDVPSGRLLMNLGGHFAQVFALAYSRDGKRLASGSNDKTVWLWDGATGKYIGVLREHIQGVFGVAFSPDGKALATAADTAVRLWDPADGKLVASLKAHTVSVNSVAFSPDGKTLTTGSGGVVYRRDSPEIEGGSLELWDVATRKLVRTLKESGPMVHKVTFSPDGNLLGAVCEGGDGFGQRTSEVRVWDVATGKVMATFGSKQVGASAVAFSPNGRLLAWGRGADAAAVVVEVATWKTVQTWDGLKSEVASLAFSPDGRHLVASGTWWNPPAHNLGALWLWDLGSEKLVARWQVEGGTVHAAAFSPDGRTVASGSYDGAVRLWDVTATKKRDNP